VRACGMALAARVGQTRGFGAYLRGNLVERLLRLGRWNEASGVLAEGLAAEPEGIFLAGLLMLRAELGVQHGELERVKLDLERLTALVGAEDWQYIETIAFMTAEAARQRGQLEEAGRVVAGTLGVSHDWSDRYAWPLLWLGLRIQADLAAPGHRRGEPSPEAVRRRAAELARVAADLPATTARAHGYRALVGPEQACALGVEADWRAAAASFRRMGDVHMLAYALLRHADARAGTGDREAATAAAAEAAAIARSLGRGTRGTPAARDPYACRVRWILALAVLAALSGCGASEQQKVVAAVRAWNAAWDRGDLNAGCTWLTDRARRTFLRGSPNPGASSCRQAFTVGKEQQTSFGVSEAELVQSDPPRMTEVRVHGDTAVVSFSDGTQSRLRKIRGGWLIDSY
jgi:hypothetical protein